MNWISSAQTFPKLFIGVYRLKKKKQKSKKEQWWLEQENFLSSASTIPVFGEANTTPRNSKLFMEKSQNNACPREACGYFTDIYLENEHCLHLII